MSGRGCAWPVCANGARFEVTDDEGYCRPHAHRMATQLVREAVMQRDHRTCQRCMAGATDWHHIRGRGAHPLLKYELANGIALCPGCHRFAHERPAAWARWVDETFPGLLSRLIETEAGLERAGQLDLGAVIKRHRGLTELTEDDRAAYHDGSWLG